MKNSSFDAELPIFWKAKTSAPTRLEPNRCGMKRNWCSSQSRSESRNVNASVRERQETRNHVWIWHIYIWYYPRKIIKHHWNIPELFFWEKMGMDFGDALCWKTLLMAGCLHLGPCRSLRSLRASAMAGGPSGPSGALGWKHWSVVCGIHVLNHIPLISIYIYKIYSKVL